MSLRIAILTPDPSDRDHGLFWPDVLARYVSIFAAAGMTIEGRSWTEPDMSGFDLVLPLLVWGYHRAPEAWRSAVDRWEGEGLKVANPPSVLRWNASKTYLGRLADAGAPVVPTIYVDRLTREAMDQAFAHFGGGELIAKPQASASAWQTIRWLPGRSIEGGPTGAAMIQPFLPAIVDQGEASLFYFDGVFSHAVRKRPQPGDFRVQPELNAVMTPHPPPADERAAADLVLAAVDEPLLYARVDLIRTSVGAPVLMELELLEPNLLLEHDPADGRGFIDAVSRAARATR